MDLCIAQWYRKIIHYDYMIQTMINRASSDSQLVASVIIAKPQKMETKSWVVSSVHII